MLSSYSGVESPSDIERGELMVRGVERGVIEYRGDFP